MNRIVRDHVSSIVAHSKSHCGGSGGRTADGQNQCLLSMRYCVGYTVIVFVAWLVRLFIPTGSSEGLNQ
jgi:hypothetical protein